MSTARIAAACAFAATFCLLTELYISRARAAETPQPPRLVYSGYLEEADGTPVTAEKPISVVLYDAPVAGKKLGCETPSEPTTPVERGRFQVPLPETCIPVVQSSPNIWVDLQVDGLSLGRAKLGTVPYAVEAMHAASATSAISAAGALDQRLNTIEKKALTLVQSGETAVSTINTASTPAGCEGLRDTSAATRSCSVVVTFPSAFSSVPQVTAGIVELDEGTSDTITRVSIALSSITSTGFILTVGTWHTTNIIHGVRVRWMAVGR